MAIITTGKTFGTTEAVTSVDLNNVANAATFNDPVDETSLELITSGTDNGKLQIKDAGVTAAKLATDALESAYPVGSIYMNASDATNPGTLLGFGTWATFGAGKVPVGIDSTDADFDVVGSGTNTNGTTGAKTHTLGITEMPSHRHGGIQPSGNSGSNSNGFDVDNAANGADTDAFQKFTKYAGGAGSDANGTLTSAGATQAHNNLQPYIVVHMWTRTA